MHTCSATQITVGSQGDTLQTVSRLFLGPDEYSGLELRISTSIKSTSNLGDSKPRQVRETLEHVFSVLIHYLKKKKKTCQVQHHRPLLIQGAVVVTITKV